MKIYATTDDESMIRHLVGKDMWIRARIEGGPKEEGFFKFLEISKNLVKFNSVPSACIDEKWQLRSKSDIEAVFLNLTDPYNEKVLWNCNVKKFRLSHPIDLLSQNEFTELLLECCPSDELTNIRDALDMGEY